MEDEVDDDVPSKSSRKRAAHAAQALGERLIALRDADLAALELPEVLLEAVREARRLRSRGGLLRQRQYIGKLMRGVDTSAIEAALAHQHAIDAREARRFRTAEGWRDRLVTEGEPALAELVAAHAGADRAMLGALLAQARDLGRAAHERTAAARELFRALRALLDAEPGRLR